MFLLSPDGSSGDKASSAAVVSENGASRKKIEIETIKDGDGNGVYAFKGPGGGNSKEGRRSKKKPVVASIKKQRPWPRDAGPPRGDIDPNVSTSPVDNGFNVTIEQKWETIRGEKCPYFQVTLKGRQDGKDRPGFQPVSFNVRNHWTDKRSEDMLFEMVDDLEALIKYSGFGQKLYKWAMRDDSVVPEKGFDVVLDSAEMTHWNTEYRRLKVDPQDVVGPKATYVTDEWTSYAAMRTRKNTMLRTLAHELGHGFAQYEYRLKLREPWKGGPMGEVNEVVRQWDQDQLNILNNENVWTRQVMKRRGLETVDRSNWISKEKLDQLWEGTKTLKDIYLRLD